MSASIILPLMYVVLAVLVYRYMIAGELKGKQQYIWVLAVLAVLLRLVLSYITPGHRYDMNCFKSWSETAASVAPWSFYDSVRCDYSPGYLYALGLIGIVKNILGAVPDALYNAVIKLPACICDVAAGLLVYSVCKKTFKSEGKALAVSALYMLSPAVLANSAVWGQVDSVFTLVLALSFYYLTEEKYYKSALLVGISTLIKMQTLIFLPVFLFAFADKIVRSKDKKLWNTLATCIGIAFGVIILFSLPFIIAKPPFFLVELYSSTMGQYPYASVNAFNLFALMGMNLKSIDEPLLFLTYDKWSTILIAASVLLTGLLLLRGRGKGKIFYCAGLVITLVFTFGAEMHERYLFPAMLLFLLAYIYDGDKKTLFLTGAVSLLQFINVFYLYHMGLSEIYRVPTDDVVLGFTSLLMVCTALYAVYHYVAAYIPKKERAACKKISCAKGIGRKDILIMAVVTVLYSVLAFVNLGDTRTPVTRISPREEQHAVADLGDVVYVTGMTYYKGIGFGQIEIIASYDGVDWERIALEEAGPCFKWTFLKIDFAARYVGMKVHSTEDIGVLEFGVFSDKGIVAVNAGKSPWFDEQRLVPTAESYMTGTYFDEVYHARTAYEHLNGIYPYEVSHPPLGKLIISAGIKMFGMNPFGWRVMGALAGVLMLPLMYLLCKRIFKNVFLSTCAMLLLTFDFMHFTQTRIATIDSFAVLFIMLMYYFMYIYYDSDTKKLPRGKAAVVLFLSGLTFGLGIAVKWICVYAGLGLAALFILGTLKREKEERLSWLPLCLYCIPFFIIIPFCIYFISYIPYFTAAPDKSAFSIFWENQKFMLSYHGNLEATHPFHSPWYSWPAISRPVWYYGSTWGLPQGKVSSIVGMGNPLVWWFGSAAVFILAVKRFLKDSGARFVVIGFLSQFLPWILISRIVFIYHYFASVPFIILSLVYVFKYIIQNFRHGKYTVIAFVAAAGVLFVMFYPVLSGAVADKSYVDTFLKWFDGWALSY